MKRYIRCTEYLIYADGTWQNTGGTGLFYRHNAPAKYSYPVNAEKFTDEESSRICSRTNGKYKWKRYAIPNS